MTAAEPFLDGRVILHAGDCLEVLRTLPDNSADSCVCDPPYFLTSIVDRFGKPGAAPAKFGTDGRFKRLSGGFMSKRWDAPEAPPIDAEFAHWMAGFIDGEGCFSVHKKKVNGCETYDCQFSISLRADDKPILLSIQKQLGGIGSIADRPPTNEGAHPQARYCISSKRDCQRLRAVLVAFPLRAKKSRDFEVWCHALDAWIDHTPGSSWEDVAYYRNALMDVRKVGSVYRPDQLFFYRVFREVLRVLKPGGHVVAFGGTRSYHRLACAIEDAGFEIRDQLAWCYGSGFPKSHDVSKAIDRALGAERGKAAPRSIIAHQRSVGNHRPWMDDPNHKTDNDIPATDAARQWQGWGTALKPSWEPIVLARKPLSEETVAANVLRWGTGALNINGCRIEGEEPRPFGNPSASAGYRLHKRSAEWAPSTGRWPANIVHDGSPEVLAEFPESESTPPGNIKPSSSTANAYGEYRERSLIGHTDSGSAARFFYAAKADAGDRIGSKHPTVKPVDLMQWLVRLVTPPGGTILEPFAGTGTTGEAAFREGFRAILIEREAEYQNDIRRRMALCLAGPEERARESIKARIGDASQDHGPLFADPASQPASQPARMCGVASSTASSPATKHRPDRNDEMVRA